MGRGSYLICFGGVDHSRSQEGKKEIASWGGANTSPKTKMLTNKSESEGSSLHQDH